MARKHKIGQLKPRYKKRRESQPPPYVCPIYRRDIASFLPREQVDEWRLTSRLSHLALSEFSSMLPRPVYPSLSIHMYNGPCRRKVDGYVTGAEDIQGLAFNTIYKFRLCCKNLMEVSKCLVGQRIFPNKPDEEVIAFVLMTRKGEVALRVVNCLTDKTAHGLVHFLRHIKGCHFDWICLDFDTEINSEEDGKMSPEVLKVLSTVHTRKKFMLYTEETHCMDVVKLKIARQLVHYREFACCLWDVDEVDQVFAFLATARPVIQVATIELMAWVFEIGFVDTLVGYFAKTVHALREAVPDVVIACYVQLRGWPRSCNKRKASAIHREVYTFHYENVHSGERFEMELKSRYPRDMKVKDEHEKVTQIRLKFD